MEVTCEYSEYGCKEVTKLDLLPAHLKECEYNPKKPIVCQQGCGLTIDKAKLKVRTLIKISKLYMPISSNTRHITRECSLPKYISI